MTDIIKKLFYCNYNTDSDYSDTESEMSDDSDDDIIQYSDDDTTDFEMRTSDLEPDMSDDDEPEGESLPSRIDFHLEGEPTETKGSKL
jgi:hypothetical protein